MNRQPGEDYCETCGHDCHETREERLAPALNPTGGDPRFRALLDRLWALHCAKNSDYIALADPKSNLRAASDLGIAPWVGVLLRMNDKLRRLNNAAKGTTLQCESIEDSFIDLMSYSGLGLILFREEFGE